MPAHPKTFVNNGKPQRPTCEVKRCFYPPVPELLDLRRICHDHVEEALDKWFSLAIRRRDGRCRLALYAPAVRCTDGLQCCHLFSRRFMFTRWDFDNARAGCPGHHLYFTRNPDRWDEARALMLGPHQLRILAERAMHSQGHFDSSELYRKVFTA